MLDRSVHALVAGVVLVVLGIAMCAKAGHCRERETSGALHAKASSSFVVGLIMCVFSGVFSAMLNLGFVFGNEIQRLSVLKGARPELAGNLIWAVALTGGFIINGGYSVYLLQRNRTWGQFSTGYYPRLYWLGALAMSFLWFGGVTAYGIGAATVGHDGGVFCWPLFVSMVIITGNVWGALTGEWTGTSGRAHAYSAIGIVILISAIGVISIGRGL